VSLFPALAILLCINNPVSMATIGLYVHRPVRSVSKLDLRCLEAVVMFSLHARDRTSLHGGKDDVCN